ncbi:MAG: bifunctional nuclease family protein [Methanosarcinaceae archaeon]|nr:bifunctional nuclease family protein [Methanosarcinaceae archaeon]
MYANTDVTEVSVKGVYMIDAYGGPAPAVLLEGDDGLLMPIYIGQPEAISIGAAIKKETMPRPLSHDLIISILSRLDTRVKSVLIDDKIDKIYYARITLEKDGKLMDFDARPSDCIALALRDDAPIMVTDSVLARAVVNKEKLHGAKSIDGFMR